MDTVSDLQVFLEQKKLLKTGLTVAHFQRYVPLIEKETQDYFQRWGDSGKRGKQPVITYTSTTP